MGFTIAFLYIFFIRLTFSYFNFIFSSSILYMYTEILEFSSLITFFPPLLLSHAQPFFSS